MSRVSAAGSHVSPHQSRRPITCHAIRQPNVPQLMRCYELGHGRRRCGVRRVVDEEAAEERLETARVEVGSLGASCPSADTVGRGALAVTRERSE